MALTVSARDSYIWNAPWGSGPTLNTLQVPFNPHDTSVKWVLVTSHFTDEETGAQRECPWSHTQCVVGPESLVGFGARNLPAGLPLNICLLNKEVDKLEKLPPPLRPEKM